MLLRLIKRATHNGSVSVAASDAVKRLVELLIFFCPRTGKGIVRLCEDGGGIRPCGRMCLREGGCGIAVPACAEGVAGIQGKVGQAELYGIVRRAQLGGADTEQTYRFSVPQLAKKPAGGFVDEIRAVGGGIEHGLVRHG